jgi:hypothetical protein
VAQFQVTRAGEKLTIAGIRTGPSTFNVVNTELVQLSRDEQFVIDGERDGFALRAVPKSGIECLNAHIGSFLTRTTPAQVAGCALIP